jgi:hypothetical protein
MNCMGFIITTPHNIIIQKFHLPTKLNPVTDNTSHSMVVFPVTSCQLYEHTLQSRQTLIELYTLETSLCFIRIDLFHQNM